MGCGGLPRWLSGIGSTCNAGDTGSIPELGRSPEGGNGNPLQYSGLENSTDSVVHGVLKSQTQLSDFHFYGFLSLLCQQRSVKAMVFPVVMYGCEIWTVKKAEH